MSRLTGDRRVLNRDGDMIEVLDVAGRANGSVQTLRRLADALGISVDDIAPV